MNTCEITQNQQGTFDLYINGQFIRSYTRKADAKRGFSTAGQQTAVRRLRTRRRKTPPLVTRGDKLAQLVKRRTKAVTLKSPPYAPTVPKQVSSSW